MRSMIFLRFGGIFALCVVMASLVQAQQPQPATPAEITLQVTRGQRDQFMSRAADLAVQLETMQAQTKQTEKYWQDYVAGLGPVK